MFRNLFLNLSLNKKLVFMMLGLSFLLLSLLFIIYLQSERVLEKQLETQIVELTQAIQVGVEEVTGTGGTDEMRLRQYLKSLKSRGIKEISIISNKEEIIASTNPKSVGTPVGPKKKELIIKAELGERAVDEEGKTYNVIIPVIAGEAHYGYVHLQINADNFSEQLKLNTLKRIAATLLVFSLGIAISIFLALRYTEPIHNVVEAAKKVAAGDLNQSLPMDRKDEIGELTESFNYMVQKLKEEKKLEERLREAEHLSAVGQLARGIAHEIRNPLNYISLSIDHLKEKYRPADEARENKFDSLISSMKQEVHRLDKLVGDFLDYGKPLRLNLQPVDTKKLLSHIVEIIKAKADTEHVAIIESYDFLPELMLDYDLMKTCLFNIVSNAFQAMPEGGTITFRTERSDGKFNLHILDTGAGVPRENLERIFEPFFTTKSGGLGLGLAITRRVIEEHGGKIDFLSSEGRGSEVSITLPLASL
ncbi:MAG TPA: ATP-binding protein [Syntrophales bacterium]|nr:ATP-binding protein [Syntrophales bacterium]HRT61328.1 ATP-binding protein [Syntrophales bacterium]